MIKNLSICNNPTLGGTFYERLAEFLREANCSLEWLVLEGNKMGDSNAALICSALEENSKVSYLNLSKNEITDIGVKSICSLLGIN